MLTLRTSRRTNSAKVYSKRPCAKVFLKSSVDGSLVPVRKNTIYWSTDRKRVMPINLNHNRFWAQLRKFGRRDFVVSTLIAA